MANFVPPHLRLLADVAVPSPAAPPLPKIAAIPPHLRALANVAPPKPPTPAPIPPHKRVLASVPAPPPAAPPPPTPAPIPPHLRVVAKVAAPPPAAPLSGTQVPVTLSGTPAPVNSDQRVWFKQNLPPPTSPQANNPQQARALAKIILNQQHACYPDELVGKAFRFSQDFCYHHQKTLDWYAVCGELLSCEPQVSTNCVR